jgi:U3 small nucleolar RNA-associated protein 19
VAAFVAVLDKDLTDRRKTAEVDIMPLLTGSYTSLVSAELARRLKRVPFAFYAEKPAGLFDKEACGGDFVGWSL